uniref:26S proteasome non-ATPase regulatory subunit RPN1 C-terminal domain-containing protein n=3 Tax=Aegilops tauschii subsp. strangulata TaxID=200361 RepID=A0A453CEE6_AEGTS
MFVGTCNEEIAQSIISVLRSCREADISKPIARMLPLALGLLYLGKQEMATSIIEESLTLHKEIKHYCAMSVMSLAFAGTGNVNMVHRLFRISSHNNGTYRGPTVIGIALIAMGEEIGAEMAVRFLEQLLQYGDYTVRRAVPLALALLSISNPKVYIMDTLSRLSHDSDIFVSMASIISMGLIGAGTNNSRIAQILRDLSNHPDDNHLFCVRIAQGLVHLGKGLLTLDPWHSDRFLSSPVALAGIVTVLHTCLNMQSTILEEYPYMLYTLVLAMQPRMLLTVDEDLKPLPVPVRVGQAVDVVGQPGQPRTISGFRTHKTPIVLAAGERAELATEKYIPLAPVLEGFVILRKNPDYCED